MIDVYTYRDLLFPAMGILAGGFAVLVLVGWGISGLVERVRSRRIVREAQRVLARRPPQERARMNAYLMGTGPKP